MTQRWIETGSACYLGGEVWPASRWDDTRSMREQTRDVAQAARARAGADYALAISPFPPLPTTLNAAPVEASVALATPHEILDETVLLSGNPAIHQSRTAKIASDLLRHFLAGRTNR